MIYFVATPIGNLKDITLRALEVLKNADLIACEDTRHSLKLLNHYGIKKPLVSFHKFNEAAAAERLIAESSGKEIAVISDAGTPLISDPGGILTAMLREKNIEFTVIPGATAFVPALILSGFDSASFTFLGFLPEKSSQKKELLNSVTDFKGTLIFYSAPQDVDRDIAFLYQSLGNRRACAVKEITKIHEKSVFFDLKDGFLEQKRGEYVILVEGAGEKVWDMSEKEHIQYYIDKGYDKKEALKFVAKDRKIPKSLLYKYTVEK